MQDSLDAARNTSAAGLFAVGLSAAGDQFELPLATLKAADATTTNALIAQLRSNATFIRIAKGEGNGILVRDKEDADKLVVGIKLAQAKNVLSTDPPAPYTQVDVLGKNPGQVSDEIISYCALAAVPLSYHCALSAVPLRHQCALSAVPLSYHCVLCAVPLSYHCALSAVPLSYHCALLWVSTLVRTTLSVLTTFPILYAMCIRYHRILIGNVVEGIGRDLLGAGVPSTTFPIIMRWFRIKKSVNIGNVAKTEIWLKVSDEIISHLGAGFNGGVLALVGLSGTGKGTTVEKLKSKLPNAITWSNGNIFRSLTLLAVS